MVDQGLLQKEFEEVLRKYPDLTLLDGGNNSWKIYGNLHFRASLDGEEIEDVFSVLITIPDNYPSEIPTVQELDGRIPKDFHTSYDNTLCLGTPLLVNIRFHERPNLLGFIEACLIEYFYGYIYYQLHGVLPAGEFSHGPQGILEHYQELFETQDIQIVFEFLGILSEGSYRGHNKCPCGNGLILRKCHGKTLLKLMKYQTPGEFKKNLEDLETMVRIALSN
jgi:hypothetical protein